jgi:50S ribosome-binding GTPase
MTTAAHDGRTADPGDLTDAARKLVTRATTGLTGQAAAPLEAILANLSDPLRVAIAGRRNSGKSTIVNALLGERAAPTDRLECTRLVAWYRGDDYDHARVVTKQGSAHDVVLLSGGRLPPVLGVAEEEIAYIEVWLDSDAVRNTTIIDTPGYDALTADTEARTHELFRADTVDAIAFVHNGPVKADELDALCGFHEHLDQDRRIPINTIGVLTKADKLDPDDPWPAARALAAANAQRLESVAATVVPVLGLMAETAATERLTGEDAWYLRRLADLPADALWSAASVTAADSDVPEEERVRLLDLLGVYGLRYALEQIRAGRHTVPELNDHLAEHSGLRLLQRTLNSQFAERADILKARTALRKFISICRLAPDGPERERLRGSLGDALKLMRSPRGHVLGELAAYGRCVRGEVELPDDLMASLRRLACERGLAARLGLPQDSPAAVIRKTLFEEGGRWNAFVNNGASMAQRDVAYVVQLSYGFALDDIEEQLEGGHE